jgi:hypothetical protein
MATIIEFYVPIGFTKKVTEWVPPEQQGKLIPFGEPHKTVDPSKTIVLPSRTG